VHREGMHYYLAMLPMLTFPWAIGLPGILAGAWPDESERGDAARRADAFLLAWIAGIVFFFSIPGAKLPTYILPAMPPLALLTARFLMRLYGERNTAGTHARTAITVLAAAVAIALLCLPLYLDGLLKSKAEFMAEFIPSKTWLWTLS